MMGREEKTKGARGLTKGNGKGGGPALEDCWHEVAVQPSCQQRTVLILKK